MRLYFADGQVPELAALKRADRRIVRRGAFEMLCQERPSFRLRHLGITWLIIFCGILFAGWVSATVGGSHQILVGGLVAGGFAGFVGLIVQTFVTERLRPFFRSYVEQHKNEIGRAA